MVNAVQVNEAAIPMRTTLLALVLVPLLMGAGTTDFNKQGFKAYQKGDHKKAHALFLKATKADPQDAFAWLNLARTTTALAEGKEPDNPCKLEKNWVYLALSYLEKAVELDAAAVMPRIKQDSTGLAELKKRPHQALPSTQKELEALLRDHANWWAPGPVIHTMTVRSRVTEGPGANEEDVGELVIKGVVLEVVQDGMLHRRYHLKVVPWAFGEGKQKISRLSLVQEGTQEGPNEWFLEPMMDCPG